MSLQLAIPRRVALQQSSLPLHQPSVILKEKKKIENVKSLNCKCANSKLSQQRGSSQATVPVRVPNQVNRAFAHTFPGKYLHRILHGVDFHQRGGRNQVSHDVIFEPDDSVAVTVRIEVLANRRRQSRQLLWIQPEQAGLVPV